MHGGYLGPVYWAVAHGMPAGVSALIVGLQPLMTAFLAAAMVGEKIVARHWFGLAVGILGVGLVVWPKLSLDALSGITPLTTGLCVLGAFSVSLGTVYQKRFATGLNLASGGVWQYAGASLVVVIGAGLGEKFGFDGSFSAWLALGWSVLVLSLAAITLLMLLIRHGDVARVSGVIYLVPAVAALSTYVVFGETLLPVQILGMAVCAGCGVHRHPRQAGEIASGPLHGLGLELFQGRFRLVAVFLRHVAADHADGGVENGHVIGKAQAQKDVGNDIDGHDEIGQRAKQDAFHLQRC